MNAVWLNDELMVSPTAVAGLRMQAQEGGWMVSVIWVGGGDERVAFFSYQDHEQADLEAEMARLSELLWPPEPEKLWLRNEFLDMRRIFDPELYDLPVCDARRTLPSSDPEHCNLAAGHPGEHRWGLTFDEAHPPKVTLTGTVFGTGGGTVSVLVDREVEEYPDLGTRVEVRATPEPRQCGSMSNAGYRCELDHGHQGLHEGPHGSMLHHWGVGGEQSPT